jgi:uncharacterized protein YbjQ (UPF0145 family)
MKKMFVLMVGFGFVVFSCRTIAPTSYFGGILYSPLTEQGIYVSESNSVSFDYVAIGSVIVEETGGWVRNIKSRNELGKRTEDYYVKSTVSKKYTIPALDAAFEHLREYLFEIGANGIINMHIEFIPSSKVSLDKIVITGMAIKR